MSDSNKHPTKRRKYYKLKRKGNENHQDGVVIYFQGMSSKTKILKD